MKNMAREYYKLWYRLDEKDLYLIWFTNDVDGVFVDSKCRVPVFYSEAELETYAAKLKLTIVAGELILHDLDSVVQWLQKSEKIDPNCDQILAVWNMLDDVFRSLGKAFSSKSAIENKVYDKLFYGNNLSAITPEGEHYEPAWSSQEITLISQTLELGLHQFRASICHQE